jgi:hypothetical protein
MGLVQIHFDGDIATNHQVSMRTLAKSLTHLQSSIDRAYLETRHGQLWKYAKMRQEYYPEVELLVQPPRNGGYIIDFLTQNPLTKQIIDRVASAINNAVEESLEESNHQASRIEESLSDRIVQLEQQLVEPRDLQSIIDHPEAAVVRRYGDRAIVREIDQLLSLIRTTASGESHLELSLSGNQRLDFTFNKVTSQKFHNTVSRKELGLPVIYNADISSLDRHNNSGKIFNTITESVSNIHFFNERYLEMALPFFYEKRTMIFVGSPLIEYGAFDPYAGDIYFLGLL